jgi:hypothetical protein
MTDQHPDPQALADAVTQAMWSRDRSGTVHPAKMAWGLKAAALRLGTLAILSGYADTVAVLGVEKWSDLVRSEAEAAITQEMDYDYESIPGLTSTGQAGTS